MDAPAHVGRYQVELVLGQGAVGRTLLARDGVIGRHVVVKVIRDDLPLGTEGRAAVVERTRQMARAAAAFFHPAMSVLLDMGDDAAAGPFVVFEFVQGTTLREAIVPGPMSRADVARIARVLGQMLALGHASGVIHGNVKPDNVMLAAHGPRLIDVAFGAPPGGILSDPTPGYTAPEVLGGSPPSALGDQFSLASTLYAAVTGRPAFSGTDAAAISAAVVSSKQPAPTSVLPELRACPHIDTIFDRALAKDPHRRFPACDAFVAALAGALESAHTPLLTPISQSSIVPRATRRWQNAAAASAVLVIFVLLMFGRAPRGQGVSLKSVAAAFATAIGPTRPARRTRAPGAGSGATTAPPSSPLTPEADHAMPPASSSAEEP